MRRFPKQARSKAKVNAIVQAARQQLRQVGYENLSTADVAKAAGVSVGTLYQFFDNKDDLMLSIAEEHIAAMAQFRNELFGADAVYVPKELLIGRTVNWMVAYNAQHPTFNQIFSGDWAEPSMLGMLQQFTQDIAESITRIVLHHAPELDPKKANLGAIMLVYTIKGMFNLIANTDPTIHPALIEETKRMMLLYFNDLTAIDSDKSSV